MNEDMEKQIQKVMNPSVIMKNEIIENNIAQDMSVNKQGDYKKEFEKNAAGFNPLNEKVQKVNLQRTENTLEAKLETLKQSRWSWREWWNKDGSSQSMKDVVSYVGKVTALLKEDCDKEKIEQANQTYFNAIEKCNVYLKGHRPLTESGQIRWKLVYSVKDTLMNDYYALQTLKETDINDKKLSWADMIARARAVRVDELSSEDMKKTAYGPDNASVKVVRNNGVYHFRKDEELFKAAKGHGRRMAATELAGLLGYKDIYGEVKLAKYKAESGESIIGYLEKDMTGMMSIPDLGKHAVQEKATVKYSPEAVRKLSTMNVLDLIAGVTDRKEEDIRVSVKKSGSQNNQVWIITDVVAENKNLLSDVSVLTDEAAFRERVKNLIQIPCIELSILFQLNSMPDDMMKYMLFPFLTENEMDALSKRMAIVKEELGRIAEEKPDILVKTRTKWNTAALKFADEAEDTAYFKKEYFVKSKNRNNQVIDKIEKDKNLLRSLNIFGEDAALNEEEKKGKFERKPDSWGLDGSEEIILDSKTEKIILKYDKTIGKHKEKTKMTKIKEPLFKTKPSVSDISQGRLGDCYFLGGIASVVSMNPDKIMENMKDNGDGTVTVRFFKSSKTDNVKKIPDFIKNFYNSDKIVSKDGGAVKDSDYVMRLLFRQGSSLPILSKKIGQEGAFDNGNIVEGHISKIISERTNNAINDDKQKVMELYGEQIKILDKEIEKAEKNNGIYTELVLDTMAKMDAIAAKNPKDAGDVEQLKRLTALENEYKDKLVEIGNEKSGKINERQKIFNGYTENRDKVNKKIDYLGMQKFFSSVFSLEKAEKIADELSKDEKFKPILDAMKKADNNLVENAVENAIIVLLEMPEDDLKYINEKYIKRLDTLKENSHFEPVYVTVEKSIVTHKTDSGSDVPLYARKTLWVQLYEKAYMASMLHDGKVSDEMLEEADKLVTADALNKEIAQYKKDKKKDPNEAEKKELRKKLATEIAKQSYSYIEGGYSNETMGMILGDAFIMDSLSSVTASNLTRTSKVLPKGVWGDEWSSFVAQTKDDFLEIIGMHVLNRLTMMKTETVYSQEGLNVFSDRAICIEDIEKAYDLSREEIIEENELREKPIEDIDAYIEQTKQNMIQYFNNKGRAFNHTPESGQYTEEAMKRFRNIERELAAHHSVAAGTAKHVPKVLANSGLNGEASGDGIVETHAYSVLNIKQDVKTGRITILLRNPWASTGRSYEEIEDELGKMHLVNIESEMTESSGAFYMEYNDFLSKFNTIYIRSVT